MLDYAILGIFRNEAFQDHHYLYMRANRELQWLFLQLRRALIHS
jgi:hypothetical protein